MAHERFNSRCRIRHLELGQLSANHLSTSRLIPGVTRVEFFQFQIRFGRINPEHGGQSADFSRHVRGCGEITLDEINRNFRRACRQQYQGPHSASERRPVFSGVGA